VLATLVEEPQGPIVRELLIEAGERDTPICVPSHFWLEITNALAIGHRFTFGQVVEAIRVLDDYGFETVDVDRPIVLLAVESLARHRLTVCDATYLVLARQLEAGLLTLDRELADAAGDVAVGPRSISSHRLTEEPAPYDPETAASWPDYSELSGYLSRLRADAETDLAAIGDRRGT
jgi:predicted nucleic acid-binding protein